MVSFIKCNGSVVVIGGEGQKKRVFLKQCFILSNIMYYQPHRFKLNKTGDKLTILSDYYYDDLSSNNGFVQTINTANPTLLGII